MGAGFSIKAKANDSAEILIYEDVGESWSGGVTARQFTKDVKALGGVKSIDLRINSGGGDVFDGLAIYNTLVNHPAKVTTHVDGLAASIASVIAMAGSEIRIAENAFMMIHAAWGLTVGNADDMRKMADILDATTGSIADVYVARTKQSRAKIDEWMKAETWFSGAEAVKSGFATDVVENMRIAAHLDLAKHKFKNPPQALTTRPLYAATAERIRRLQDRNSRAA